MPDFLPSRTHLPNRSLIYSSLTDVFYTELSWSFPLLGISIAVLLCGPVGIIAVLALALLVVWTLQAKRLHRHFEIAALSVAISPAKSVRITQVNRRGPLLHLHGFLSGLQCGGQIKYSYGNTECCFHENFVSDRAIKQIPEASQFVEVKAFLTPGSTELVALLHDGQLIWVLGQQPFYRPVTLVCAQAVRQLRRLNDFGLFVLIFLLTQQLVIRLPDWTCQEWNIATVLGLTLTVLVMALLKSAVWCCKPSSPGSSQSLGLLEWWCSFFLVLFIFAFGFPGMMGISQQRKQQQVVANMRSLSSIVESYARLHGGQFPAGLDAEIRFYYPGGFPAEDTPGSPPINPFTKRPEWPIRGTVKDIGCARQTPPEKLKPGAIEYSPIMNSKGKITNYAIRGGNGYSLAIGDGYDANWKERTLVLCATQKDFPRCAEPRCLRCRARD